MERTQERGGDPAFDTEADTEVIDLVDDRTRRRDTGFRWRSASTRVGEVELPRPRGWRRAAPPPRRVPQGEIHAYEPGSDRTACGRSLDGLHPWEDRPFGDGFLNRCLDCVRHTRGA